MSKIRSATAADIPQIVELYSKVFGGGQTGLGGSLRPFLENVMLHSPWRDGELPSLVCEGTGGKLLGFLGVFHRPMLLAGEPIRAAISNLFMVEPSTGSGLAALQLMQAFFRGPQDLSIAEGNPTSRKLWDRLGGETSLLYSMNWVRPLRPTQYLASQLPGSSRLGGVLAAVRPALLLADAVGARIPPNRLHRPGRVGEEALDVRRHLECLEQLTGDRALRPVYDEASLDWLMKIFEKKKSYGDLHRVMVRDESGRSLGCYAYYSKAGEVGKVLQMVAEPDAVSAVLESLCHHAWSRGAVAVSGGLDPTMSRELTNAYCFMGQGANWVMIHGRPGVLESFDKGRAFFSRLESEWMFYRIGEGGYGE